MAWRIGVADSGVGRTSPSGRTRIIASKSFVDGASLDDDHGHGSACWAAFEGALSLYGIRLPPIEVVYAVLFTNRRPHCSAAELAAAIAWMTEEGAQILALPCGAVEPSPVLWQAVHRARSAGAVVIAAAGVDPLDPLYPAAYDGVVAVQADGNVADSSRAVMFAAARALARSAPI